MEFNEVTVKIILVSLPYLYFVGAKSVSLYKKYVAQDTIQKGLSTDTDITAIHDSINQHTIVNKIEPLECIEKFLAKPFDTAYNIIHMVDDDIRDIVFATTIRVAGYFIYNYTGFTNYPPWEFCFQYYPEYAANQRRVADLNFKYPPYPDINALD